MKQREPKKNDALEVRLPSEMKAAFMQACKSNGVSASGVLRGCIYRYLLSARTAPRDRRGKLRLITTDGASRQKALGFALGTFVAAVALWIAATPVSAASDPRLAALFEWMDIDRDGRVSSAEFQLASRIKGQLGAVSLEVSTKRAGASNYNSGWGFAQIDMNGDAALVLDELEASCVVRTVVSPAILAADTNRNGAFTEGELAAYLTAHRIAAGGGSPSSAALMAKGIILKHDADGDGNVVLDELRS